MININKIVIDTYNDEKARQQHNRIYWFFIVIKKHCIFNHKVYKDVFIWRNGEELNITNWSASNEPNTSGYNDEACVLLTSSDGWKVSSCKPIGEYVLPLCEKAVTTGEISISLYRSWFSFLYIICMHTAYKDMIIF